MAGPMPGTNALAHCHVAHLNRQEDLQCWPPSLIINLGIDSEGPRCLPSKFQEIYSGIHYFAEVKGSVLVVKETSQAGRPPMLAAKPDHKPGDRFGRAPLSALEIPRDILRNPLLR